MKDNADKFDTKEVQVNIVVGFLFTQTGVLTKHIGFPSRAESSSFASDMRHGPNSFPKRTPAGFLP